MPSAVAPEIAAEAAVWVARLHGPDRSRQMERECLQWQSSSVEHRLAFERCTEVWQGVPHVKLSDAYAAAASEHATPSPTGQPRTFGRRRWAFAFSVIGLVLASTAAIQTWHDSGTYRTAVGEQRLIVLEDCSRMSLNTATRVRVDLAPNQRTVSIEAGEVLFEVAKDAQRPFVVRAAGSEVVALGTVFSVRLTPQGKKGGDALAVTLLEGQVSVRNIASKTLSVPAPARQLLLRPGERAQFAGTAGSPGHVSEPHLDRPRMELVLAWKRGEAVFEDVSLVEAIAEMNRYSRTPIVLVGDPSVAQRRISGVYRVGESAAFARAVAVLHRLALHERRDRLELSTGS